ncbi:hypothetical protein P7H16_24625 [Paenibacillus larvae]|nr:hypothetical protein [Paenibacillus larvae]MDT2249456.1 hypothetical protein [Paenibacillus larvae]
MKKKSITPTCGEKANPNLGVTYDLEKPKNAWEKRKNIPAERSDMIVKRFNIFVKADEMSFIDFITRLGKITSI